MSEALRVDSVITTITESKAEASSQTLRECVKDAIDCYFQQLDGHPAGDLYKMVMDEVEEPLFRSVLEYTGGNQSKASELLGINRGTLRKKLKLYGLHD
ncbi:MAG: DNA-binding transcriptional regulator Fis [Gammaproteobacteria bacterium]|jgi:Fis family transcriptional regulator|nr:DNA-binding transcriptional regulator Fis [Gammaproteobacteria bacterium]